MSFRRVIVAFDGSDRAADALALAVRLCEPDARLTLACVVPGQRRVRTRRPNFAVVAEHDAMFAEARATIPPGIRVRESAPVAPSAAHGLTELAESESADLIVVGSSRHGGTGHIRLERTAGRLLQGAPCAVAIAPGGLRDREGFRHIGIAYDDSPEARAALGVGYEVAARCGAAVTLMYALSDLDAGSPDACGRAEAALDAAADGAPADVNPRTLLLRGAADRVIRDACDGIVDLLVTGSRGYGPIHLALLGSVSEDLTEGATHPVLVVPRPPAHTTAPVALHAIQEAT